MLISKKWLEEYVKDLPNVKEIAEILTMRAFEVEKVEEKDGDGVIDVKILPNRAHDCLCHKGIAREIATLLDIKFNERKIDLQITEENATDLEIKVDNEKLCPRYMGKKVKNIETKDSPEWLRQKLEVLGERSINNIVDITNFVMLDMGQPMHAFDADKVKGGIHVRLAKNGEKITLLTGEEVILDESVLLIADDEGALAIAGIKGGRKAEVTENTKNIILESANFNSIMVRKSSQKLGIKNNASKRYENEISPDLAETALNQAVELISKYAATEKNKYYKTEDVYSHKRNPYKVSISLSELNKLLGTDLKEKEVVEILDRTGWRWQKAIPREEILKMARENLGKPYKYGASISFDSPNYFDCSSFVAYLYAQTGIAIPRITADQFIFGEKIENTELKPGDIVFSQNSDDVEEAEVKLMATGEVIKQKVLHTKTFEFLPGTLVPEGIDHNGVYLGNGKIAYASGMWHRGEVVEEDLASSISFKNIRGYKRMADLDEERFVITTPSERLDLRIKEDLVEEIGRIYGYEKIESTVLKNTDVKPKINDNFAITQKARLVLMSLGYSEVYNYAFRNRGEVEIENPTASNKAFLRNNLKDGLEESLELNFKNAPLLGLDEIKIFEIGTVFSGEKEKINVAWGSKNKKDKQIEECALEKALEKLKTKNNELTTNISLPQKESIKFKPISSYPFILRDVAVWTTQGTKEEDIMKMILENASELLVQKRLFDKFEKDGKISYAFNLVFQSQERTLTDSEINNIMEKITITLNAQNGWQVR